MNDILIAYGLTLAFLSVFLGLLCVYKYYLGNRLIANANTLKSRMATIKQWYPELDQNRSDIVAKGIGDIGVSGILDELGIDSNILKNPLVKGLIDKYAPRVLEQLSKGQKNGKDNIELL